MTSSFYNLITVISFSLRTKDIKQSLTWISLRCFLKRCFGNWFSLFAFWLQFVNLQISPWTKQSKWLQPDFVFVFVRGHFRVQWTGKKERRKWNKSCFPQQLMQSSSNSGYFSPHAQIFLLFPHFFITKETIEQLIFIIY